jgi:transcriptional regulator with XRE-family HTH domain
MVDIGSIIKDHLRQNGSSVNQLAKQMKLSATQLYYNLKHNHITIERLDQISRTLNHNFFDYLAENKGSAEEEAVKLRTEIKELSIC